jgi:CubicO group peptidase (beta-lactamase class C family)
LLSHTAGLGNPLPLRWVRPAAMPATDLTERLIRRHGIPKHAPGGPARYSNVGYLLLGRAIEESAGMPFTEYVRTAVLEPAGMHDTGYAYRPGADRATGYVGGPAVLRPLLKAFLPRGIVGPRVGGRTALQPFLVEGAAYGGLVGNVLDAARLARLHLRDGEIDGVRVLSAASAVQMRDLRSPGRPFDHGLAWFRKPGAGGDHVEHYGAGAGFWNAIRLYPDAGLGMVVMANTTAAYDVHTLFTELRTQFGEASAPRPPRVSPPG